VSRVGWQNWQMQRFGITRPEAVARFKPWKNQTLAHLRAAVHAPPDVGKEHSTATGNTNACT
ncbi:MAG: hypothetical protein SGPRY_014067, partial [Prymnesium sp.]